MEPSHTSSYPQALRQGDPHEVTSPPPDPGRLATLKSVFSPSRPAYSRLENYKEEDHSFEDRPISDTLADYQIASRGLGLNTPKEGTFSSTNTSNEVPSAFTGRSRLNRASIARVPVGSKSPPIVSPISSPEIKYSGDPLISPSSDYAHLPLGSSDPQPPKETRPGSFRRHQTGMSLNEAMSSSLKYDDDSRDVSLDGVPPYGDHYHSHSAWVSIGILFSSIFSTVFSGIFLGIAIKAPRYSTFIGTNGALTVSNAVILTAIVAKLIELTFATACVAFVGQVLSRRVLSRNRQRGITLAEMTMRNWIMQPGSLITHWEGVRYAGVTLLGALSVIAAVMATLYTSAASALVQPQLRFGHWEDRMIAATVKTKFANPTFLKGECQTPIASKTDDELNTCLQIQHASQGYHNYQRYLAEWANIATTGFGSKDLRYRPQGIALLYDNTTITGPWIDIVSVKNASAKADGRVVNNVTLVMPHAGVIQAARDKRNRILQPEDLDGLGVYKLHAAVSSPAINVLCTNVNEAELRPLIWETWPTARQNNTDGTFNITRFTNADKAGLTTNNKTALDSIYNWGNQSDNKLPRPIFAKYPKRYNTILSAQANWGANSIYLLGNGSLSSPVADPSYSSYLLCSMRAFLTPDCSTHYSSSQSGSQLDAICDPENDAMAQSRNNRSELHYNIIDSDWPNIASEAARSWSLNTGISDGDASNSRLLTQLLLPSSPEPELYAELPSPAEALAVIFSGTLLLSTMSATFVTGNWNYTGAHPMLSEPYATQFFKAVLRAQQYASGPADGRSHGWYLAIFSVFIINVMILIYFLIHRGSLITDFSETPNLFSLAVNSPPSSIMRGASNAGPRSPQYNVPWIIQKVGGNLLLEPRTPPIKPNTPRTPRSAGFKGFMSRQRPYKVVDETLMQNLNDRETGQDGFREGPNRNNTL